MPESLWSNPLQVTVSCVSGHGLKATEKQLKKPLAEKVLFGDLSQHGGVVSIRVEDGELVVVEEEALA